MLNFVELSNFRSLPELSLVKESSIRGLNSSTSKPSEIIVSSSHDGELIIVSHRLFYYLTDFVDRKKALYFVYIQVNGDQELLFVSTLLHKEAYRYKVVKQHPMKFRF